MGNFTLDKWARAKDDRLGQPVGTSISRHLIDLKLELRVLSIFFPFQELVMIFVIAGVVIY